MPKRKMPPEETVRRVQELIDSGTPIGKACEKVGVNYTTFYRAKKEMASGLPQNEDMTLSQYQAMKDLIKRFEERLEKVRGG